MSPRKPPSTWVPSSSTPSTDRATSKRLSQIRQQDTLPERELRSRLHRLGLRFRKNCRPVPQVRRTADVVFPRERVAIFIDGCFWHGCPTHGSLPKNNAAWWQEKIQANEERDRQTNALLDSAGWHVIRVWEHEELDDAARRICHAVLRRR